MSDSKPTPLRLVKGQSHRRQFLTAALATTAAAVTPSIEASESSRLRVVPIQPEPPPEFVQEALDVLLRNELADFASSLETARTMWRRYPALVEGHGFPENLREALVAEWEDEPSDDCELSGEPCITDEMRERARPLAEDIARSWAAQGHTPRRAS